MTRHLVIDAPAKINLGLEILGKREDGFHEIRSILATINVYDTLEFRLDSETRARVDFHPHNPAIDAQDDLIASAIREYNRTAGTDMTPDVSVTKRIPVAAGLGGASSDCAATLIAMNAFASNALHREELVAIAATIGSDIPFFLGSPTAIVSGRGTTLHPVPTPMGAVLIVSPTISIPQKTKTLYGSLNSRDYSDGSMMSRQLEHLDTMGAIDPSFLNNAFSSALYHVSPESAAIEAKMAEAGISKSWLSGAGPSRYALFDTLAECQFAEARVRQTVGDQASIFSAEFLQSSPVLKK